MLCAIAIIMSGILGALIALFSPFLGMFVFLAFTFAIAVLALGLIAVILKFMLAHQASPE